MLEATGPIRTYPCRLVRVVDADTCIVQIDIGFRVYTEAAIRIVGVNAPELATTEGKLAREWAVGWFAQNAGPPPWPYTLVCHGSDPRDKYGRWVSDVVGMGHAYAADVVAAGNAVPYLIQAKESSHAQPEPR